MCQWINQSTNTTINSLKLYEIKLWSKTIKCKQFHCHVYQNLHHSTPIMLWHVHFFCVRLCSACKTKKIDVLSIGKTIVNLSTRLKSMKTSRLSNLLQKLSNFLVVFVSSCDKVSKMWAVFCPIFHIWEDLLNANQQVAV
jgi:hypothetical protein